MKKRTAIRLVSYLSAAVLALGVFSWVSYSRAEAYKRITAVSYQRAFSELCTSMSGLDAALQKSLYATSPSMTTSLCTEVFGKAMAAQLSLGVLPFSTQELEQTASFVSRVGDYASVLSRAAAVGTGYTEEERENLKKLSETASLLSQNLTQMQHDMYQGWLTMDDLYQAERQADAAEEQIVGDTVGGSMRLIEQEFPETPSLIYDGPFSEHLMDPNPKLIEDAAEVSGDLAKKTAAAFLGVGLGSVTGCEAVDGTIPAYRVGVDTKDGAATVTVTRRGGQVLNVITARQPGEAKLDAEKACAAAGVFLKKQGYHSMAESYHMVAGNVLTVNFAYEKDGILFYPDLIKVSIAMDNGALAGFDAAGYVSCHYKRDVPQAEVSVDEARALISNDLKILAEGLTVIPTAGKYEVLCHEFKCEAPDGRHYIIYVNAVTGLQEKILILIEDENGALTM